MRFDPTKQIQFLDVDTFLIIVRYLVDLYPCSRSLLLHPFCSILFLGLLLFCCCISAYRHFRKTFLGFQFLLGQALQVVVSSQHKRCQRMLSRWISALVVPRIFLPSLVGKNWTIHQSIHFWLWFYQGCIWMGEKTDAMSWQERRCRYDTIFFCASMTALTFLPGSLEFFPTFAVTQSI